MSDNQQFPLQNTQAKSWDDHWIQRVSETSEKLGHPICGAHTADDTPCRMTPDSPNGRCRFHGGVPNIGGQLDNFNALIHGLFSRRLQTCGPHCPLWAHCPYAGDDLLDLPQPQRPKCYYEQQEYDLLVDAYIDQDPHYLHTSILLKIMLGRAAAALSVQPYTEKTTAKSENYSFQTTRIAPALQAFLRLHREHRYHEAYNDRRQALYPPEPEPDEESNFVQTLMKVAQDTQHINERLWKEFEGMPREQVEKFMQLLEKIIIDDDDPDEQPPGDSD